MEIKESVYTLRPHNKKDLSLYRDNRILLCPHSDEPVSCATWCPAFKIQKKFRNIIHNNNNYHIEKIIVHLQCFPQSVSYPISKEEIN